MYCYVCIIFNNFEIYSYLEKVFTTIFSYFKLKNIPQRNDIPLTFANISIIIKVAYNTSDSNLQIKTITYLIKPIFSSNQFGRYTAGH